MKTVDIKLERLSEMTEEEFAPYGYIIGRQDTSKPGVHDEPAAGLMAYPDFLPFLKNETGRLSMGMLVCRPKATGEVADWMEYHEGAIEFFFPLDGKEVVFVLAPVGDKPDLDKTKAIIVGPDEGIMLNKCTWHRAPYALNAPSPCLMPRYGDLVEKPNGDLIDRKTVYYGSLADDGSELSIRIVY